MKPMPYSLPARMAAAAVAGLVTLSGSLVADQGTGMPTHPDAATITHVLNRIGFGPRPGDVAAVERMGLAAYIDAQLHPERIDDSALDARLASFETLTMSSGELAQKYFLPAEQVRRDQQLKQQRRPAGAARPASAPAGGDRMMAPGPPAAPEDGTPPELAPEVRQALAAQRTVVAELTQARMLRAVLSERQLQEVMTDFWLNHFNVFIGKGPVREYLTEYERDAIRPRVLGSFRDLLGAVAHSPAMLFYLDNWQSSTPTPPVPANLQRRLDAGRLTPQQRARLMGRRAPSGQAQAQRPARGINENYARELMELHTLGVDGGYTQDDVIALARILTGWTIDRPRQGGAFVFRPMMHDTGTKTLLGVTFGSNGQDEGERALDLLARHPATAHHIAYQLAQRFVADEPPVALVERAARTFLDTRGDIREVVRTIVTSPEFFAPETRRAKVKTPLEFVASAVRATGATVANAQPLVAALQNLGMPLYGCQPPTGYSMTADAWVNTGALLNRMNFAVQLVNGGRIAPQASPRGGGGAAARRLDPPAGRGRGPGAFGRGPIQVDVRALAPDTTSAGQDAVVTTLLGGTASDATRGTLARAETPQNLIALALGAPEFQRR
jgi:uncharacterized protein (DUF1800 family)